MSKDPKEYLLKGQSLVEVLIALGVGTIFVLGVILAIQFSLKANRDSEKVQIASALASELMDNVKIFIESDWHNILNLATTSANHYYLNTTTTPFSVVSGEENIILSTTTYVRYFYVDDVYRDETGKIVSGSGTFDPSTKKITVVYRWEGGSNRFITSYVTRSHNNIFIQTDWSGGGGQLGPISYVNNMFSNSENIKFSDKGYISLNLPTFSNFMKSIQFGGLYYDVLYTQNNKFLIAGDSIFDNNFDIFVALYNSGFDLELAKRISIGIFEEYLSSFKQTSDGGYILGGITNSAGAGWRDMLVIKLDSFLNIQWLKTIGGNYHDEIRSLQQTSDGGYILGGYTANFGAGSADMFLVKLDSSGNIQWSKTIGGGGYDYINSLQQTSDGGYILGGYTSSFGAGSEDMFLVKLDSSGNIQWSKTIGGSNIDYINSLQQTSDGGYILGGYTSSFGAGSGDMFLVKLDSSGNIQWSKIIEYSGRLITDIQILDDGYLIGGNGMILKVDQYGNIENCNYFSSPSPSISSPSPSVSSPSPSISSPSPSVSSPSPSVSSLDIEMSTYCEI